MMKICIFLGAGASAAENLPIQNEIFSRYFKYSLPKHPHSEMNKTLVNFFKEPGVRPNIIFMSLPV